VRVQQPEQSRQSGETPPSFKPSPSCWASQGQQRKIPWTLRGRRVEIDRKARGRWTPDDGGCAEFAGALPKIVTKSCRHACDCAKVVRSRWRHPSNGRRRAVQCTKCRPRPDLRSPLPPHVGASRDPGDGDVCCMHGVGFAGGGREHGRSRRLDATCHNWMVEIYAEMAVPVRERT
jgi:hypothetical protein